MPNMSDTFTKDFQDEFLNNKVILDFDNFLQIIEENPDPFLRNSSKYLLDTFKHFKTADVSYANGTKKQRFKLFDLKLHRCNKIVGGERIHSDIFKVLEKFECSGHINKLIVLHGPNGSSKSSTVESIMNAMEAYSRKDAGRVYRFNWIFPIDKEMNTKTPGINQQIGFSSEEENAPPSSFAFFDEHKIASKLISEFNENPIYLIPMPYREKILKKWISKKRKCSPEDVTLPPHILLNGLSKRNQQIFEALLNAYNGDLNKVYRHVQVERFFYSKQYRVGISTVEPQMSLDAAEKQITLDKNLSNLPTVLQTMSFFQSIGPLVESNRGLLEFSDLLKRPIETFKYLLNTIEQGCVNFTNGTTFLDTVFFATTNEKHLDGFKTTPDFSSFKGRFDLITVPYLLIPSLEKKIYTSDIKSISKEKKIAPHCLDILCMWATMTRLKQPDPENYRNEYKPLILKLDPLSKIKFIEGQSLQPKFNHEEQAKLEEVRDAILGESSGLVVYEGRFGASPREIRSIIHRASQNALENEVMPFDIFLELENISKDRTIYEFLQFEPRGKYHDHLWFIYILKEYYYEKFELELVDSMEIAEEEEYHTFLKRYISHVVSFVNKDKIWDEATNTQSPPSQNLMEHAEKILNITEKTENHREKILSRLAAYKIDNPNSDLDLTAVFSDLLQNVKAHFYNEKRKIIDKNIQVMLSEAKEDKASKETEKIYQNLIQKYSYTKNSAFICLQKFSQHKNKKMSP